MGKARSRSGCSSEWTHNSIENRNVKEKEAKLWNQGEFPKKRERKNTIERREKNEKSWSVKGDNVLQETCNYIEQKRRTKEILFFWESERESHKTDLVKKEMLLNVSFPLSFRCTSYHLSSEDIIWVWNTKQEANK